MRRIEILILTALMTWSAGSLSAQSKREVAPSKNWLVSVSYGMNGVRSVIEDGISKTKASPSYEIRYICMPQSLSFDTGDYGFSVGFNYSNSKTSTSLTTEVERELVHPDNGETYTQIDRMNNWKEEQKFGSLTFGVEVNYRYVFTNRLAAMAGFGPRWRFQTSGTYSTQPGGTYSTTGYFASTNVEYSNLVNHSFSSVEEPKSGSVSNSSFSVGCCIDTGIMFRVLDKTSLYAGIYYEYVQMPKKEYTDTPFDGKNYTGLYDCALTELDKSFFYGIKLGVVLH